LVERVIQLSTNFASITVKVENPFHPEVYLVHTVTLRKNTHRHLYGTNASSLIKSTGPTEYPAKSAARLNKLQEATHLVILLKVGMHILFDISALCLFALALTVAAIARRVSTRRASPPRQEDFAQHLFTAAEEQNSRAPRSLSHQTISEIHAKKGWGQSSNMVTAGPTTHKPQSTSPKRF
jgi:hypothetical protein